MPPEGGYDRRELVNQLVASVADRRSSILVGPAGIGKSYTLRQVLGCIDSGNRPVIHVRATTAMASVPFGNFLPVFDLLGHTVLSSICDLPEPLRTAAILRRAVLESGAQVLVVDDAHLLDAPSAGLVHQLASAGLTVLATNRSGESVHDAIATLIADGTVVVHELRPLGLEDIGALLTEVLGGSADSGLCWAVHQRSSGHPLTARVLAQEARRQGSIGQFRGVWVLKDQLKVPGELLQLVRLDLDALTVSSRRASALVAIADGLPHEALVGITGVGAVDEGQRAGILVVDAGERVAFSHPLYRESVLSQMTAVQRRGYLSDLIAARASVTNTADRVAMARWTLELGKTVPVPELMSLAELTLTSDPVACEAFLRSAIDVDAGTTAVLRLAEVLAHQHRAEESVQLIESIDVNGMPPAAALGIELTKAFALSMPTQRPDAALRHLDGIEERFAKTSMIDAVRAVALWRDGQGTRAAELASPLFHSDPDPVAAAHAGLTLLATLNDDGESDAAHEMITALTSLVTRARAAIPEGPDALQLSLAKIPIDSLVGLDRGELLARKGYVGALARGDDGLRAQWGNLLGLYRLLAGHPEEAVRLIREAEIAKGIWSTSNLPWLRSGFVCALVAAGMQPEAESVFVDLVESPHARKFDCDLGLARAAVMAGRGDLAAAAAEAIACATAAPDAGRAAVANLWYAAVRYGNPRAAGPFLTLTEGMRGGRQAQRDHVAATLSGQPRELELAASRLKDVGLGWYALDAMAGAVAFYRRRNDGTGSAQAMERLRTFRDEFPALNGPVVRALQHPELTKRESQIARLAAAGHSDKAIASGLYLSTRTVESHLAHVYAKLGIGRRNELASIFESP